MGEAYIDYTRQSITINATIILYGHAADTALATAVADSIERQWNEANGTTILNQSVFRVYFVAAGFYMNTLTPEMIYSNTNPRNNYFRVEVHAPGNISFVDGIGSNTGFLKLDNLLHESTTAAHEFGHTLGLHHPLQLDIRGRGTPGIMYPRGTWVDAPYQYNPAARPGEPGSTLDPSKRKVLQQDIDALALHRLHYNGNNKAVIGSFTSVWHPPYRP